MFVSCRRRRRFILRAMEKVSTFIPARGPDDFLRKVKKSLTSLNEGHQFTILTTFRMATARATYMHTNEGRSSH